MNFPLLDYLLKIGEMQVVSSPTLAEHYLEHAFIACGHLTSSIFLLLFLDKFSSQYPASSVTSLTFSCAKIVNRWNKKMEKGFQVMDTRYSVVSKERRKMLLQRFKKFGLKLQMRFVPLVFTALPLFFLFFFVLTSLSPVLAGTRAAPFLGSAQT